MNEKYYLMPVSQVVLRQRRHNHRFTTSFGVWYSIRKQTSRYVLIAETLDYPKRTVYDIIHKKSGLSADILVNICSPTPKYNDYVRVLGILEQMPDVSEANAKEIGHKIVQMFHEK